MNYQHQYHAGNFADVCKHLVLAELMQKLTQKETAFGYLDTHAGAGLYDLTDVPARKTQEYVFGIETLMQSEQSLAHLPTVAKYMAAVKKVGYPTHYPGSPWLAKAWGRAVDQLIFIEKHPETANTLKQNFKQDKQTVVHLRDAYEGLLALLPLKQGRGLILIDPAYEVSDEWSRMLQALEKAVHRYRQGIFVIWYPIKADNTWEKETALLRKCMPDSIDILQIELSIFNTDVRQGLIGSGMMVLNPPWQLQEQIGTWLPSVWQVLSQTGQGSFSLKKVSVSRG
ncbi:MAG: hypothetical protein RLZ35_1277 [Pseudomonadota bacterium]|jgi:23S rRNA (adenine2030-N6)-methyltransferase